jgi:hypothetical protein
VPREKKTEEQNQALGRSRGGFSTKIHVRCNAAGLPIGIVLSEGEAHDVTAYDGLMQQRDNDPGAMLADKGYDSDVIRLDLLDSGATPEIPTKSNRKLQYSVSKPLYALRSRIECLIGHTRVHPPCPPSRVQPTPRRRWHRAPPRYRRSDQVHAAPGRGATGANGRAPLHSIGEEGAVLPVSVGNVGPAVDCLGDMLDAHRKMEPVEP